MAYGTIKVDTITFTDAGVDKSVTISGLVQNPTFSGNITVTGTVSGNTIQGQTVSGATITGGAAAFTTVTGGVATITSGVFALGSASNPSISFNGDANSGLYSPGADQVAVSTGGTGRLFVDASGNVGIGGAPTLSRLTVTDAIASTTIDGGSIETTRSDGFYIQSPDNTRFYTAGSERLRITSAGLVGIGTSSPAQALSVVGGISATTPNGTICQLTLEQTSQNAFSLQIPASTQRFAIKDLLANAERFVINSAGNVGIGTTSPNNKLEIAGTTANVGLDGTSNTYINFLKSAANIGYVGDANWTFAGSSSDFGIRATSNLVFGIGANERARIDSSGRLLVGTSSSSAEAKFIVQGGSTAAGGAVNIQRNATTASAGSTIGFINFTNSANNVGATISAEGDGTWSAGTSHPARLVFSTTADGASSPTERLRITSAGLVGIGTSTPGQLLQVGGFSGSNGITVGAGSSNYSFIYFADGTAGTEAYRGYLQYNHATDKLELGSAGLTAVTVDSAGRVGIGTTSPGSKLSISTAANSPALDITDASTSDFLITPGVSSGVCRVGPVTGAMALYTGNAERARIDTSGRLLVGTSSSSSDSVIVAQGYAGVSAGAGEISLTRGGTPSTADQGLGTIKFQNNNNNTGAQIDAVSEGSWTAGSNHRSRLTFSTTADGASSPTERMRITSSGAFLFGKTTDVATENGAIIGELGQSFSVASQGFQGNGFHRNGNDGGIIGFFQDGTQEGSISVSGGTVSYNGAHLSRWSQLASGAERIEILRGSVLSNLDEMCEWGEEENEQLNRMKVSDIEGDKNVSGVFQAWDDDDDTYTNDFYCAMTGDFIIRIAEGVTVERGDLLMSAGDGTAKPQDDDIIRSKTIAKVTSTNVSCTYDDGSYCVPCVLMAC
jgi:hypothetical protein